MKSHFWKNKKVLVTGGAGFIGSHVVEQLVALHARVRVLDNLSNGTLNNLSSVSSKIEFIKGDCTNMRDARRACKDQDVVLNIAAHVGGIELNRTHQATMMRDNLLIAMTMIEAASLEKVDRFLVVSSACIYPKDCSVPTKESEGFQGEPEPTNGGYGWAKRVAEKLGQYYAEEFSMKVGIARPYNCYGPRDNFDPEHSHVIPALIKRVLDGENPLRVWGSGKQTRAFLFVDDFARGLIETIEKYPNADPVNLGTNEEVSIKKLVKMIVNLTGANTKIEFDTSKPDGSARRNSDNKKVKEKVGFEARTKLIDGLRETIEWYKKNIS